MAQFPIKNALIQGTLDGTPASGNLNLSNLTLALPTDSLQIGVTVQAYDADLATWAGVTPAAGITTFLATPSGANLATALTSSLPASKGGTGLTSLGTGIATMLGINTGSAGAPVLFNGALGTPSSGTISGSFVSGGTFGAVNGSALTALTLANITPSTSVALGVGSLELGHATDTTIARVSAGVISVEGVTISTASNTLTLSNKTISGASNTITDVSLTSGVTGTLPVANGGTGVTTLTGLALASGTSAFTSVTTTAGLYGAVTDLFLDHKIAIIDEDFIGGTNADGSVGQLGWRIQSIAGTASSTYVLSEANNPGQFQIGSGIVPGDASSLYIGGSALVPVFSGSATWEIRFTFKLNQTTLTRFRLGMMNDKSAVAPGRGEFLRYDTSAGDTNFKFVVVDGGAETATNALAVGGGALAADTAWHTLRIRTITPGSYIYGMSISTAGGAFGTEVQVTNTNGVGGLSRFICMIVGNDATAAAKSAIMDACKMRWICSR